MNGSSVSGLLVDCIIQNTQIGNEAGLLASRPVYLLSRPNAVSRNRFIWFHVFQGLFNSDWSQSEDSQKSHYCPPPPRIWLDSRLHCYFLFANHRERYLKLQRWVTQRMLHPASVFLVK